MNLVPLGELFDIKYGTSLELNGLRLDENGINFVSRTEKNNGVSARVQPVSNIPPLAPGQLTVALSGSVLECFLQVHPFYTGYHIACLQPTVAMSDEAKLYYAACIRSNRYRYSYGRQANRTLRTLLVPSVQSLPSWISNHSVNMTGNILNAVINKSPPSLETKNWKDFRYDEVFIIKNGYYNKKPPLSSSGFPFIGASENKNGITGYVQLSDIKQFSRTGELSAADPLGQKLFTGNCITVSNDGSVGEAFYQAHDFTCSHSVNVLYLKSESYKMSAELALFLCTLIRAEKFRWGYGRKWRPKRMPESIIKLPVIAEGEDKGEPDWLFMENFIQHLPYSTSLADK